VVITDFERENNGEVLRYTARLSRADMAQLWVIIERIGFQNFNRSYTHERICITDRETYRITVRFSERVKEVEVYDPHCLAEFENNRAAVGFLDLWEAIHQNAPHGKVLIAAGHRKPWWQFW
jgi:hypothetical protein